MRLQDTSLWLVYCPRCGQNCEDNDDLLESLTQDWKDFCKCPVDWTRMEPGLLYVDAGQEVEV